MSNILRPGLGRYKSDCCTCMPASTVARTWSRAKSIGVTDEVTLLRDLFGISFRPATIDPAWLTWDDGDIPRKASSIYKERAIGGMTVLADALEEAGCDDHDILQHCRSRGEHVQGCRALVALLGRS